MFTHLHTHSYYSFLEGLSSPAELARKAADGGMLALALTDHNGLSGAVEFYEACLGMGVRPILGLDLDLAAPAGLPLTVPGKMGNLVLLAADLKGWASLCRLSSLLQTNPDLEPSRGLPFENLVQNTEGLICLTGGQRGLAARLVGSQMDREAAAFLGQLGELFPGRLFVELQKHSPQDNLIIQRLAILAWRLNLPVVTTHSIEYCEPSQAGLQPLSVAIRLNQPKDELPEHALAPPGASFLSQTDMAQRFSDFPEALSATQEIAERCRLELPLDVPHFPEILVPSGLTPNQVLRQKAETGAQRLYGGITPEIRTRLDHELDVIARSGFTSLFLVMEEILDYARQQGVPFSSRGSAASSLVAHCLGITTPDPLRLNLYFERFLNPARSTPPDIDTDLCSRRRDEVIRFVYDRFGADRVAMVCTINRFRHRSALRETAKAYGLSPTEVNRLVEALPRRGWGPPGRLASSGSPYEELAKRFPHYQAILSDADALLGIPRHLSIHPGGIVISPGPLTDLVPTQLASKGIVITQFDLDSIERLGLVKLDLLGIRGLTVLGDVAQSIQGNSSRAPLDVLDSIPEEDLDTADLVRGGRTIGCFQIESPGMRATLKEIQAASVDDLMVALALYRPGPLTGGLKDAFVRRHRGQEKVSHLHNALGPLLADTHGVILYQEQVLRIANELAGLSLADADLLRRAMSHFDPGGQMRLLKARFIAGASERSGVPEEIAERVWELMAAFAGYGFPKAHAASYAQVAWRAAWCKAHYPAVFMAAVLANWGGYYGQRVYLMEARRMGLVIRPPQVNYARREFSVSYLDGQPMLFMGLDQVRDLTRRTMGRIQRQRPFYSLTDFLARVDPRPIEAENLARVGALADFGSVPVLLHRIVEGGWRGGQLPLFSFPTDVPDPGEADWPLSERVSAQEAILGVGIDAHPLELVAEKIAETGALTTLEAAAQVGRRVRVAGMRQIWRRSNTESGEHIYFMSLEDLEGMLDVVIFPDVYRRNRREFSGVGPYMVEGIVEPDPTSGEPIIRAERIWRLASP